MEENRRCGKWATKTWGKSSEFQKKETDVRNILLRSLKIEPVPILFGATIQFSPLNQPMGWECENRWLKDDPLSSNPNPSFHLPRCDRPCSVARSGQVSPETPPWPRTPTELLSETSNKTVRFNQSKATKKPTWPTQKILLYPHAGMVVKI